LAAKAADAAVLPDINRMKTPPSLDFGNRASGARINRGLKGSNVQQIGVRSGDVVLTINGQPVSAGTEVAEILRGYPSGRPALFTVARGSESVRLTGRFAPAV